MNKKAFTLIELLVVITIITLLTSGGVVYFFKQITSLRISREIESMTDIIDNLNSQVGSKKILDYFLFIDKNSLGFTGSINNVGLDSRQKLSINFTTGTGTITSSSGTILKIYSGIKYQGQKAIGSSGNTSYNFLKNQDSKIVAFYSGAVLNTVFVHYYSQDNIIRDNENTLSLVGMYSNKDKSGGSYDSVKITNVNGSKTIEGISGGSKSEVNKVYLLFEREGIQKFIEIKK